MTLEQIEAEIAMFKRQQENQKKLWRRCGQAFFVWGLILCAVVGARMALTGEDPPPPMLFITLTSMYVGLAFSFVSYRTAIVETPARSRGR
jgi:hypothetical protein